MPIAKFAPTANQPKPVPLPKTEPSSYKGIVVDDKYNDFKRLSGLVEGYPLTVDFYGQKLGESNDVREIDVAQSSVFQQYYKVIGLSIKVEDPLSLNSDDNTQLSTITGSAIMPPDVRPNTFDYFVFATARGRKTLFRITNVTRLSMQRDSMYKVEYQMVGYVDEGQALSEFNSLECKVIEKYVFRADRQAEGLSPLLSEADSSGLDDLLTQGRRITDYYMGSFFNPTYQTLTLPGQGGSIYDKFLVDYLLKIVSVQDHENVIKIRQLGSDDDRYMKQPQFWFALLQRNALYLSQANRYMGVVNRRAFNNNFYVAGARMSTIDAYIYPRQVDTTIVVPGDQVPMFSYPGLIDTLGPASALAAAERNPANQYVTEDNTPMSIYRYMLSDISYVHSEKFYNNLPGQCLLEKVTWDYMENRVLQIKELTALINGYYTLTRLEQFYYGPLILTFIKDSQVSAGG